MLMISGSGEAVSGFVEFMYEHILSACFAAPLKLTFDLNDGHASLVKFCVLIKTVFELAVILSFFLSFYFTFSMPVFF